MIAVQHTCARAGHAAAAGSRGRADPGWPDRPRARATRYACGRDHADKRHTGHGGRGRARWTHGLCEGLRHPQGGRAGDRRCRHRVPDRVAVEAGHGNDRRAAGAGRYRRLGHAGGETSAVVQAEGSVGHHPCHDRRSAQPSLRPARSCRRYAGGSRIRPAAGAGTSQASAAGAVPHQLCLYQFRIHRGRGSDRRRIRQGLGNLERRRACSSRWA